ncbi:hypothetical protein ABPG73_000191 [Tetrahymena malaccensis]
MLFHLYVYIEYFQINIFRKNQISNLGAISLGEGFSKCTQLQKLQFYICKNLIGNQGASHLLEKLSKCAQLSELTLFLEKNLIGDQGAFEISKWLVNFNNLKQLELNLGENEITEKGYISIGTSLSKVAKLMTLMLTLTQSEKYLKSSDLANCKNINNLHIDITNCFSVSDQQYQRRKALKIKRLVKLKTKFFDD